jgi:HlyD family secretion protein
MKQFTKLTIGGRKLKKKFIKPISITIIILVAAGLGYWGYQYFTAGKASSSATRYATVTASKMDLDVTVQGTGAVFAPNTASITAPDNGTISKLNVKTGDSVSDGTAICTLSGDSQLQQSLNQAEINLKSAQLQLTSAEDTLASDQTNLANSKTTQDVASNTSKVQNDQLNVSSNNLKVESAQESVNEAESQISALTIKSPINGVVVAENNNTGDSVQSGAAIATVSNLSSLEVNVAVDELDIAKVKTGQTAQITFGALPNSTFQGTVESIAQVGTSTNNVTTYNVTVSIANPTGVMIGMNANVTIAVQSKADALVVPTEALVERNGNKYVMIDNSAASTSSSTSSNTYGSRMRSSAGSLVQITTGLVNENYIEVTSGVTDGEKLLIALPQTTATTTNTRSGLGGFGLTGGSTGGYNRTGSASSTGSSTSTSNSTGNSTGSSTSNNNSSTTSNSSKSTTGN